MKIVLLSVRPKYVTLLFNGEKTIELRRVCPNVEHGDVIFIYATHPIKAVTGVLKVVGIIRLPIDELWQRAQPYAGVSRDEFYAYFSGKEVGYGIEVERVKVLENPVELKAIRIIQANFRPPQSYMYLSIEKARHLFLCKLTRYSKMAN